MAMNTTERQNFEQWFVYPNNVRPTGWKVWQASLAYRGVLGEVARQSRPAFNTWLDSVRHGDWTEFDAWMAAAEWFLKST